KQYLSAESFLVEIDRLFTIAVKSQVWFYSQHISYSLSFVFPISSLAHRKPFQRLCETLFSRRFGLSLCYPIDIFLLTTVRETFERLGSFFVLCQRFRQILRNHQLFLAFHFPGFRNLNAVFVQPDCVMDQFQHCLVVGKIFDGGDPAKTAHRSFLSGKHFAFKQRLFPKSERAMLLERSHTAHCSFLI